MNNDDDLNKGTIAHLSHRRSSVGSRVLAIAASLAAGAAMIPNASSGGAQGTQDLKNQSTKTSKVTPADLQRNVERTQSLASIRGSWLGRRHSPCGNRNAWSVAHDRRRSKKIKAVARNRRAHR